MTHQARPVKQYAPGLRMTTDRDGVVIRYARPYEGERLREIAFTAKAHWGYDPEWVRRWVANGDFSTEALRSNETFVADDGSDVVAWAMLVPRGDIAWLEDMWVVPSWMRKGVGARLFERVAARARELGARRLEWEAEPNAVGFYEKVGGRYVRDSETSEWGRVLQIMGCDL
jgi:GNAT superfamily N-acetyltransferase